MRADLSRVLSQYFLRNVQSFLRREKLLPERYRALISVAAHVDDSKQSQIKGLNRF